MAYNTKPLVTDNSNLKPAPQYFNVAADAYEAVEGSNGASKVQVSQPLPAGANIIGLVKLSDGTDALAVNTNGSINIVPVNSAGTELFTSGNPGLMSLTGSNVTDIVLLNAVSVTGRGSDKPVSGTKTLTIEVFGTATSFSLQIEGKSTSGTSYAIQATNLSTLAMSANITSPGIYQIDVTGLVSVDANLSSVTGGNVTAQGKLVA